ncbi:MAG: preprotein translocase subunit SecE [Clostridia bacterium]|nr:preprotein translocase subunit SecE [Clostridia bacterium]
MAEDKNVKKKGFLKGMKLELKKVIWPTGEQTVKSTFATIAFVIMVSLVLIVFNLFFNWLSNLWIRSLSHEDVINNVVISSGEVEKVDGNTTSGEETSVENPIEETIVNEEESEPVVETSGE